MIIDGSNLILGRLASVAAKKSLLGEKIDVVNCQDVYIVGDKKVVLAKFKRFREMGNPHHGPFFPRMSDRYVRRVIRGMLPHKNPRGQEAYKRVMCHLGVPEEFKSQKLETIPEANISKVPSLKYVTVGQMMKLLGGK